MLIAKPNSVCDWERECVYVCKRNREVRKRELLLTVKKHCIMHKLLSETKITFTVNFTRLTNEYLKYLEIIPLGFLLLSSSGSTVTSWVLGNGDRVMVSLSSPETKDPTIVIITLRVQHANRTGMCIYIRNKMLKGCTIQICVCLWERGQWQCPLFGRLVPITNVGGMDGFQGNQVKIQNT